MRKVTKRWRTRNGKSIRICDMTDKHLQNAIHCIRRCHDRSIESAYAVELMVHPDSEAAFLIGQQIASMEREDPAVHYPILADLEAEAMRRRLEVIHA